MERREAPGSLRDSLYRSCEDRCERAKIPGPKCLEGVGVPGRAGPQALRALRLPALQRDAQYEEHRSPALRQTPRSTTHSIEQGRGKYKAGLAPGDKLLFVNDIKDDAGARP